MLSFGGFLGIGNEHYPLPWQALKYDTNLGGIAPRSLSRSSRAHNTLNLIWRVKRLLLIQACSRGIILNEHEGGEIGPALFQQACNMGLEWIISKHYESAYRPGPCKHWIKVKNPRSPAMLRAKEADWSGPARKERFAGSSESLHIGA